MTTSSMVRDIFFQWEGLLASGGFVLKTGVISAGLKIRKHQSDTTYGDVATTGQRSGRFR